MAEVTQNRRKQADDRPNDRQKSTTALNIGIWAEETV